jgi:acetamidase/formamidase
VLHIKPGDRVVVETRDAFEGKIKSETDLPTKTLQMPFLNPQNRPIMVDGTEAAIGSFQCGQIERVVP